MKNIFGSKALLYIYWEWIKKILEGLKYWNRDPEFSGRLYEKMRSNSNKIYESFDPILRMRSNYIEKRNAILHNFKLFDSHF